MNKEKRILLVAFIILGLALSFCISQQEKNKVLLSKFLQEARIFGKLNKNLAGGKSKQKKFIRGE